MWGSVGGSVLGPHTLIHFLTPPPFFPPHPYILSPHANTLPHSPHTFSHTPPHTSFLAAPTPPLPLPTASLTSPYTPTHFPLTPCTLPHLSPQCRLCGEVAIRAPRVLDFRHFALQIGTYRYYSKNAFFLKKPTPPRVPSAGIFCVKYLTFLSYACVFIQVRKLTCNNYLQCCEVSSCCSKTNLKIVDVINHVDRQAARLLKAIKS